MAALPARLEPRCAWGRGECECARLTILPVYIALRARSSNIGRTTEVARKRNLEQGVKKKKAAPKKKKVAKKKVTKKKKADQTEVLEFKRLK